MNKLFPAWSDGLRKLLIDRGDGSHAERVEAYPPVKLLTDGDGASARLRVDNGQTGFFAQVATKESMLSILWTGQNKMENCYELRYID